ncbi:TRIM9_67 [Mytilus edulis]|uniref:TRIM9_67 n=1 Tax=Mytilus edulis TaxID=6550 RepID=A0A8S3T8U6_MYTED|nr:TRIM9_67 [Mytilus edulis]
MASSVKQLCTICNDDGISNSAVTWCTECEVLFCGDCEKPHSKSHLSKNHKTMSADDYQKLPTFMQEISSQCQDHKKKFELYCSFHACPCCVQCVTDKHNMCQEMKPLSDILQQVKSSASVQLFEKDLKDVKENIDTAIKYLQTRITTSNTQNTKAIEKIRYMRKSIDDYLNKLEQDLLNDLESKYSKLKSNMASLMQQMEQRASQINQMQSQFSETTQYTTELQRFIGLREVEKITSQTTRYIEDLESGDHFIEKNLEVNLSSALQSFYKMSNHLVISISIPPLLL